MTSLTDFKSLIFFIFLEYNNINIKPLGEVENEKKLPKIAEFLKLTERSIRYKIDEINEELGTRKIEIKKREFFSSLTDEDMTKLIENIEGESYVYNQKEREELIILYTLMKKDNFLLKEVAEKLGTSKSTIRNDLKNLIEFTRNGGYKLSNHDKMAGITFEAIDEGYKKMSYKINKTKKENKNSEGKKEE